MTDEPMMAKSEADTADDPQAQYTPQDKATYWIAEIEASKKRQASWKKGCERIIKRYREEQADQPVDVSAPRGRYPILYSNIQTIGPAIYTKAPKPEIGRRFKDKDQVGRDASRVIERVIEGSLDQHEFDDHMQQLRDDFLLTGRGQAWVVYEPSFQTQYDPVIMHPAGFLADQQGNPLPPDDAAQVIPHPQTQAPVIPRPIKVDEQVCVHRVLWDEWGHSFARTWTEVTYVWRLFFLTRRECIERFGEEIGKKVPMDYHRNDYRSGGKEQQYGERKQAVIYEVWDRSTRKVMWYNLSYSDGPLQEIDDPLHLEKFFPCPKPLLGITGPDSILPRPDFTFYMDQANQLDLLTLRITVLSRALRLRGLYCAAGKNDFSSLFSDGDGNEMIPVDSWQAFADKGGIKGMLEWVPLDQVSNALKACIETRDQILSDIYQITGISDIMRGATDPQETMGAQSLKSQWGSLRVRDRQGTIARFCRDIIRIMSEIVSEHFDVESLAAQSNLQYNPQQWTQIKALLTNQHMRDFRIEIEVDSIIAGDEEAEKASRTAFLEAVGGFIREAMPLLTAHPQTADMLGQMLMFLIRAFRVGAELEDIIEQTMKAVAAAPPPPPQGGGKGPSPEQLAIQQGQLQLAQRTAAQKAQEANAHIGLDAAALQDKSAYQAAHLDVQRQKIEATSRDARMDAKQ